MRFFFLVCGLAVACTDSLREAAWEGDALHKLDIRRLVLQVEGLFCVDLVACEQVYVTNAAQAVYWRAADTAGLKYQPRGTNDHSIATAFEANYQGDFRQRYLALLPVNVCKRFTVSAPC